MALIPYPECSEDTKSLIRTRFSITESVQAFDAWASWHAFYIRADGHPDERYQRCEVVKEALAQAAEGATKQLRDLLF
jgi:hypothetical protein